MLFSYVSMHMLNHMLGIVSLSLAEAGLRLSIRLWQSLLGTVLLYGAFSLHLVLALRTIHLRRDWRLPATEWFRLWSGFGLPLLLITHAVSTRVATSFYGFTPSYEKVIAGIIDGDRQGWQLALIAPGWVHGCLGLWIGLRHHPRIQRAKPVLVAIMVAVPVLSATGFIEMSLTVAENTDVVARHAMAARPYAAALAIWRQVLQFTYIALVIGAGVTGWWRRRDAKQVV